ncbi:hypothetical protein ES703_81444 [subsurface metagenome]
MTCFLRRRQHYSFVGFARESTTIENRIMLPTIARGTHDVRVIGLPGVT